MIIDKFASHCTDQLFIRTSTIQSPFCLYLLVDGAFVSGVHRIFQENEKRLLFDAVRSTSNSVRDVSPFLIVCNGTDQRQRYLLARCSGWPMVSVIQTSETLGDLFNRLAAWSIVEVDNQRFNFRFADSRRLPAIYSALSPQQRATFIGPMSRWTYVGRNGCWSELSIESGIGEGVIKPILNEKQFSLLVEDSRVDEILLLLRERGCDVFSSPSRSFMRIEMALRAALEAGLNDNDVLEWCLWFWCRHKHPSDADAVSLMQVWQKEVL